MEVMYNNKLEMKFNYETIKENKSREWENIPLV